MTHICVINLSLFVFISNGLDLFLSLGIGYFFIQIIHLVITEVVGSFISIIM